MYGRLFTYILFFFNVGLGPLVENLNGYFLLGESILLGLYVHCRVLLYEYDFQSCSIWYAECCSQFDRLDAFSSDWGQVVRHASGLSSVHIPSTEAPPAQALNGRGAVTQQTK